MGDKRVEWKGSSIPICLESDKKAFITNSLRLSPLVILSIKAVMAETASMRIQKSQGSRQTIP
jgi:hypothetical protein